MALKAPFPVPYVYDDDSRAWFPSINERDAERGSIALDFALFGRMKTQTLEAPVLAGVISISGHLLPEHLSLYSKNRLEDEWGRANQGVRILITAGSKDEVVPLVEAEKAFITTRRLGLGGPEATNDEEETGDICRLVIVEGKGHGMAEGKAEWTAIMSTLAKCTIRRESLTRLFWRSWNPFAAGRRLQMSSSNTTTPDIIIVFRFSNEFDRDLAKDQRRKRVWDEIHQRLSTPILGGLIELKMVDVERVAILVTCSDDALSKAFREEGIREFLFGGPAFLLPSVPLEEMTPATRCRLAFTLITSPKSKGGVGIGLRAGEQVQENGGSIGQADLVDVSEFVPSIFPLMDIEFNEKWVNSWAFKYTISTSELDAVRDVYGEEVAYYFAFEYFYFQWLIPIGLLGAFAWATGLGEYRTWWAASVILWAIAFTSFWSRRAVDLSHRWGTFHVPTTEPPLPTYNEENPFINPFTGNPINVKIPRSFVDQLSVVLGVASGSHAFERIPIGTVLTTMLVSFPAQFLGFLVLLIANAAVFSVDTWVFEYYNGPWKTLMTLLPLTAFLMTGPPLAAALTLMARKLNGLENYPTNTSRDRNLTFKLFAWNGMAALFPVLFLIYVNQLVDMLVENLLPRVLTALGKQAEAIQRKGVGRTLSTDGIRVAASTFKRIKDEFMQKSSGDALLDQIRAESFRDTYDVFTDFAEMTIQASARKQLQLSTLLHIAFGNVVLFSVAFPLAPLVAMINNYFELRTDAAKFTKHMKRPIPKRVAGTPAWEDAMGVLCFGATLTNATLIAYYTTDSCDGPCTGPILVDWGAVAAAMVAAQVFFLAARHLIQTFAQSIPIETIKEQAERERVKRADLVSSMVTHMDTVSFAPTVELPASLSTLRVMLEEVNGGLTGKLEEGNLLLSTPEGEVSADEATSLFRNGEPSDFGDAYGTFK
ncbi:hypothetical protein HDU93_003767 [Gonapodya sp. JEL0774]|nr:hypothetical protein HDU93_003767 [Gonapodya sp. JEL0774]